MIGEWSVIVSPGFMHFRRRWWQIWKPLLWTQPCDLKLRIRGNETPVEIDWLYIETH